MHLISEDILLSKNKVQLILMCSYTFTEASEALSSGPLLVQHGIDLVQRVGQLAESLRQEKKTKNKNLAYFINISNILCSTAATGLCDKDNIPQKGEEGEEACFIQY